MKKDQDYNTSLESVMEKIVYCGCAKKDEDILFSIAAHSLSYEIMGVVIDLSLLSTNDREYLQQKFSPENWSNSAANSLPSVNRLHPVFEKIRCEEAIKTVHSHIKNGSKPIFFNFDGEISTDAPLHKILLVDQSCANFHINKIFLKSSYIIKSSDHHYSPLALDMSGRYKCHITNLYDAIPKERIVKSLPENAKFIPQKAFKGSFNRPNSEGYTDYMGFYPFWLAHHFFGALITSCDYQSNRDLYNPKENISTDRHKKILGEIQRLLTNLDHDIYISCRYLPHEAVLFLMLLCHQCPRLKFYFGKRK